MIPTTGNDVLNGTNDPDFIDGLAGDDTIDGMGGNDILQGSAGNDTLTGGVGDDIVSGGLDDDTFVIRIGDVDAGGQADVIFENSGEGTDTILLQGINAGDIRMWTDGFGNLIIGIPDGAGGYGELTVDTNQISTTGIDFWDRFEVIEFGNGETWTFADGLTMVGLDTGQEMNGAGSDDRIEGRQGNDLINGFGDSDVLIAGKGDDTLQGGGTLDTGVADFFVFQANEGDNRIIDFEVGVDKLVIVGAPPAIGFEQIIASAQATQFAVTLSGAGTSVTFSSLGESDFSESDFIFL